MLLYRLAQHAQRTHHVPSPSCLVHHHLIPQRFTSYSTSRLSGSMGGRHSSRGAGPGWVLLAALLLLSAQASMRRPNYECSRGAGGFNSSAGLGAQRALH